MFNSKAVLGGAMFLVFLYGCGSSQPARTNVLSKTNPPASQKKPAQTDNRHPNQTVFQRPEQVTRNTPVEKAPTVNTRVERRQEPEVAAPSGPVTYRSAAYYKNITDSIQRTSAKSSYYKMTESLFKEMAVVPNPNNPAINAQWYTTVNFDTRRPNYVILHHTAQGSAEQTLFTFSISRTGVSAHYVVGREGITYQMLNDYMRAWHAGRSKWGSVTDMNSCSIGIEIDNNGTEPFSDAQMTALLKLLGYLKDKFGIPQANFIAHSDIAPGRKSDPSKLFPWKRLADAGFGFWYDPNNLEEPPVDFNAILALRVIGYDTRNQASAIQAFKLHFIQNDSSAVLSAYDKKVLYNVYKNY